MKIVLFLLVGAAMIGGGAVYLVNVENKVVVETPTPPVTVAAPVVKSREQLSAEYR